MENEKNLTDTVAAGKPESAVTKDASMDIASLLKSSKEEESTPVREKSNLEKLKEAKANGSLGLVVDKQSIVDGSTDKPLVTNKSIDDGLKEADEYMAEQDQLIAAARSVSIVNKPQSAIEMASMMTALDNVVKTGQVANVEAGEKQFISEKTENDEATPENTTETTNEAASEEVTPLVEETDNKRSEIVNILIDKTGFGGDFAFTEEEREKIFSSTEIRLKEVEEVDLASITVTKAEKSFLDSVQEFQISSSKVPVVFPASRFRAYMTGLTYGEMGDISLNGENITFDQVQKKLTVIYNKMVNPSIGKFESFEDFLKKFSYIDMDLAIYGLVVATFPEVDDIPLTCNNAMCKKSFNHKFSPRTLLRFEKSDESLLETMRTVADCPADKAEELHMTSPTVSHKRFRLPISNFIIEVGIASAYDYLYTMVDNLLGNKFAENHPEDVNGILQLNSTLLGLIRSVYVPNGSGSYVQYTDFEDIIQALYMVKPEEITILSAMLSKYIKTYSVNFELFDITCPHCGTRTKRIALDINYLVFLKYQRLMSTELNLENISLL